MLNDVSKCIYHFGRDPWMFLCEAYFASLPTMSGLVCLGDDV